MTNLDIFSGLTLETQDNVTPDTHQAVTRPVTGTLRQTSTMYTTPTSPSVDPMSRHQFELDTDFSNTDSTIVQTLKKRDLQLEAMNQPG